MTRKGSKVTRCTCYCRSLFFLLFSDRKKISENQHLTKDHKSPSWDVNFFLRKKSTMQRHHWTLTFRKTENLKMSVEFWKKLFPGKLEGLHWRLSKSFLWHNGKRHVNMWLAKHFSPESVRVLASDMGWTHHGAKGHHKAALIALLEVFLWYGLQNKKVVFILWKIPYISSLKRTAIIFSHHIAVYCIVFVIQCHQIRDLWNRYTREHHPCCGRNLASTFCS